jgi:RNA polymerase primary sigma factor
MKKTEYKKERQIVASPPRQIRQARESRSESVTVGQKRGRAERLLQQEVSFIHSREFERPDAEKQILETPIVRADGKPRRMKPPKDVPAYLASLWETPLLQPEEERGLFRRMNYLKFFSNVLRSRLNPRRPRISLMNRIEHMRKEAEDLRNRITQANLRLVVSIARRFAAGLNSFDELVSDGNVVLMNAVDKFDYSRGFRFSTYATHAVQRHFYRQYKQTRKRRNIEISTSPEVLREVAEARNPENRHVHSDRQIRYMRHLMDENLPERERRIIESRYGLNEYERKKTLREIGEELGISKERVRQLLNRAEECLRDVALDEGPDILPDAANLFTEGS